MAQTEETRLAEIAALERELRGYEKRGLPDRAAAVKAELRRHGSKLPAEAAEKRTTSKRRSKKKED